MYIQISLTRALITKFEPLRHSQQLLNYFHISGILTEEIESNQITEYVELLKCLQDKDDIVGLPPGGGLQSKWVFPYLKCVCENVCWLIRFHCRYHVIERTFKEVFPESPCEVRNIFYNIWNHFDANLAYWCLFIFICF